MRIIVYMPFVISLLLGPAIPHFGRRLAPAAATRLLVAAGVVGAGSSAFALICLAWTYVGQIPMVADVGDWSVRLLQADDPVPTPIATLALLILAVVGAFTLKAATRHGLALRRAARACREMTGGPDGLVVVDDPVPQAYAVPGRRTGGGRIVVTTAMLRTLSVAERRVLIAHERAHLRDRHHLYRTVAAVTAALNPLLRALPAAVDYTTERWADERAAADAGDRRTTARAITRAALATTKSSHSAASTLGFGHGDVPKRVTHLLAAPPRRRPLISAVLIVTMAACLAAANEARADTESLFEKAYPSAAAAVTAVPHPQTDSGTS
ncbi:M56 family metallopeptidase [Nonomuraea sp. NPDC049784]|uniref:M56 family metallopeptidase n=1 Tax=Nonomuraea sp. NPDC049784 TaxID=3154361 RepID=UPI0033CC61E4